MIWCLKSVCRLKCQVQLLAICCIPSAFYSGLILSLTLLGLHILTSFLINSYWFHDIVHLVIHMQLINYGKYSTISLLVSHSIIILLIITNNIRMCPKGSYIPVNDIAKKNLFVCMQECETL